MIEKMASIVVVDDLDHAVPRWRALTGVDPTFVDAGRWAQFDIPAGRIALATAIEAPHGGGVMFKVRDLEAVRDGMTAAGLSPTAITTGTHERRFVLVSDDVAVTYYSSS